MPPSTTTKPRTRVKPKLERPKLYKGDERSAAGRSIDTDVSIEARNARSASGGPGDREDGATTKPRTRVKPKLERPKLYKVILVNDDFTPREFVVMVLQAEFSMSEDQALRVMITAHQKGVCVVAVFTRDVAETKAARATDAGKAAGFPLMFTTEPEE